MGYYTRFEVSATGFETEELAEFFVFKLNRQSAYDFSVTVSGTSIAFDTDEIKWYEWETELSTLSRSFPGVTIYVEGHGEEQGDIWRARIRDGESEIVQAKMTFPDFERIT